MFVPADKAVNNVIIVCKKEVVANEITATTTYEEPVIENKEDIIGKHLLKSRHCYKTGVSLPAIILLVA